MLTFPPVDVGLVLLNVPSVGVMSVLLNIPSVGVMSVLVKYHNCPTKGTEVKGADRGNRGKE